MPTLGNIRRKTRLLAQIPSSSDMSNNDVNNNINSFIKYDFPSELNVFSLKRNLTFYTIPNVDTYETNDNDVNHPLYNFKNKYYAVYDPLYIGSTRANLYMMSSLFYGQYPKNFITNDTQLRGDATVNQVLEGFLTAPVLQNSVTFNSITVNDQSIMVKDNPLDRVDGLLSDNAGNTIGTMNYITGEYSFFFPQSLQQGATVYSTHIAYSPAKPNTVLYQDNKFIIRPVPDNVYPVTIDVDVRPASLEDDADIPELEQWWEFIAYGAAIKCCQDLGDEDTLARIQPEFERQKANVISVSTSQKTKKRTPTVFSVGKGYIYNQYFGPSWPY